MIWARLLQPLSAVALGLVLALASYPSLAQVAFDPGPIRSVRSSETNSADSTPGGAAPQSLEILTDTVGMQIQIFARSREVAVVVLPTAGVDFLPRSIVEHLVREEYSVVSVRGDELVPTSPEAWLLALYEMTSRGVAAARLARDTFAPRCLVIAGVSLGGFASIPVAVVSQADAVITALAGGDLTELAETSAASGGGRMRVLAESSLRESARAIDPQAWAPQVPKGRSLVIRARWDRVVPERSVQSLLQALRDPKLLTLPASHETSALFHSYASRRIVSFVHDACNANL